VEKQTQADMTNREAGNDHENKLAANVKSDSFYKSAMSRKRRNDDRVEPITDNQRRVIINDEEAAEAINKYFGSVYEKDEMSTS